MIIFCTHFFTLSEPIWVCDLGPGGKNQFFYYVAPDFDGVLVFLPHAECVLNKMFLPTPKLKVCGGCFWGCSYIPVLSTSEMSVFSTVN
jgi:hypothetical protein